MISKSLISNSEISTLQPNNSMENPPCLKSTSYSHSNLHIFRDFFAMFDFRREKTLRKDWRSCLYLLSDAHCQVVQLDVVAYGDWDVGCGDGASSAWGNQAGWRLGDGDFFRSIVNWLVVWNMNFIFHNIWDNPSHWLSYFSRWLEPPTSIGFNSSPWYRWLIEIDDFPS